MKNNSDLDELESAFADIYTRIATKQEEALKLFQIAGFKKLEGQSGGRETYRHGSGFDIHRNDIKGSNGKIILDSFEAQLMSNGTLYEEDSELNVESAKDVYETLGKLQEILGYDFSVSQLRIKEHIREEKLKSLGV
jgi:hypothetical protein